VLGLVLTELRTLRDYIWRLTDVLLAPDYGDVEELEEQVDEALEDSSYLFTPIKELTDEQQEQVATLLDMCRVEVFSSRMCEKGTKSCVIKHSRTIAGQDAPDT
jgi:hypothetical protein